jgi:SAM-dependent methyltransferase
MTDIPMKHLPWWRLLWLAGLRLVFTAADVVLTSSRPPLLRWWVARALSASPWTGPGDDDDDDLIYGEMFVASTWLLFRRLGVGRRSTVVDLGCGRGAVLVAAVLRGAQVRGVEVVPARLAATTSLVPLVQLCVQDARVAAVSDASVVWVSWATWSTTLRASLAAHLAEQLPDHALVVGVLHGVNDEAFEPVGTWSLWCSWGRTDVVVSRRRPRG